MGFNFVLTQRCDSNEISAVDSLLSMKRKYSAGVYDDGLVTLLDSTIATTFLDSWSWLVGHHVITIATTGFGDVFFFDKTTKAVSCLDIQRAEVEFIDDDIGWLLESFLLQSSIQENVLRKPLLDTLVKMHRPLEYLESFILEPWLLMGGEDRPDKYVIHKSNVYVDLVGQTLEKRTP